MVGGSGGIDRQPSSTENRHSQANWGRNFTENQSASGAPATRSAGIAGNSKVADGTIALKQARRIRGAAFYSFTSTSFTS
jgi:hypothetical protein